MFLLMLWVKKFTWSYNMGRFEGQAKNWVEIYYSNFFDKSKFNIKTKKFSLEKAEDNPQLLADKILYIIDEINKSLISKNEFNNKLKSDKDLIISEFSKMDIVLKDSNIAVNNLGYDIVYSSDTERLKVVVIIKNNQILVDSINKEIRFDYSNRPVLSKETLN